MAFRVVAGQFMHETNTFSKQPADPAAFRKLFCFGADEIDSEMRGTNSETGGFIEAADAHGWEIVHTVSAFANPCGKVTDEAWRDVGGLILEALRREEHVDGVILALHGAMVSESYDDAEGQMLKEVRALVGPDVPIALTLDLHANCSPETTEYADIVCAYRTYPHIDMAERGRQAGDLLDAAMRGRIRPKSFFARPPAGRGCDGGRSDCEPMISMLAKARRFETEADVLSVSVFGGFTLADIPDLGPSAIVTADMSAGEADGSRFQAMANELSDDIWATKHIVNNHFYTPDEAAALAAERAETGKPLVISDFADNPGSGAYGDATNLLKAMIDAGLQNACFGGVRDAEAAAILVEAGVGAEVTVAVGGKADPRFGGPPLELTGTVRHVGDGDFVCDGPMWKGIRNSSGPTAVLRVGEDGNGGIGIDVLVVSNLQQITDIQQFLANGIDPRAKKTVGLKSKQHFRAAYEPIAEQVIVCDSGALSSPNMDRLTFDNIRRPLWPFDPEEACV